MCQFLGPEIVIMGQLNLWPQKLTLWVSFWAQKLKHFVSFWSIKFFQEFWPIEKENHNLNIVWIMYESNRNKKNQFEQKLATFKVFWAQKPS